MPAFDVASLRSHFPSLDAGVAFFDAPGGTQTPRPVGDAIAATLTAPLSNRGTQSVSELNAERVVSEFRGAFADLLAADPRGIVYGRSATQLTYDFSRHLSRDWGPGDEVVVTRLDHDSNVRPWVQAAERTGATVQWIDLDPKTGELDTSSLSTTINARTRLVAVTAASNLIGTVPDVAAIAEAAHSVGALVYVDGVHYTAHRLVDLSELGADFFVCSPYKFMGPHCAVLAAAPQLLESMTPDKLLPSPNAVPERFEFGTLPYEIMAGATAAVDFIAGVGSESDGGSRRDMLNRAHHLIGEHEHRLAARILSTVERELDGRALVHSTAADRTPTLFLSFPGRGSQEISRELHHADIHAPAGSFYAYETFNRLRVEDDAGLRLGVAPYTSEGEVDRLLDALISTVSIAPRRS
ncbi:cysteine desulfurase-like protein [Nesterenkonia salmonea]|uniref:Cysteine desulfurase-like protein n=1 Tax=Nesterenkonia salmonea TaxID=1804987 RepID=A0A5R9BB51_9MICC|nr:cysteine desulfurase-like protein [Nesterenkonia salmonea]TLP97464.1 cysteine desulfurase-like protein [Nesterenkonia salmonea]